MSPSVVPHVFWITLLGVPALMLLATVLGRACAGLLPARVAPAARFYLAPAIGIALLTVLASLVGRYVALGRRTLVALLLALLLGWLLARRKTLGPALRQGLWTGAFALACGAGILVPLLVYGAFNTDNDTFTYLAHAQWLQTQPFGAAIAPEGVTPFATQILLYQQAGYRMGASYLLALLQSLAQLRWAYLVYPTLLIGSIASCCLALGMAMARQLRPLRRPARLALLALPAFLLGGLTFGANFGFLPQTVGMALATAMLALAGPVLRAVAAADATPRAVVRAGLLAALLFAGATLAYSELSPFVTLALAFSAAVLGLRARRWRMLLLFAAVTALAAALLLNIELLRAYAALRVQAGVVAGSAVDWRALGFVAHAFGVHGGAWDGFQWAAAGGHGRSQMLAGLLLLAAVLVPVALAARALWRAGLAGPMLPLIATLAIFGAAGLYFRYGVASPFPTGVGQSWNQAKLADWAFPSAIALTVFALARLAARRRVAAGRALLALAAAGVLVTASVSIARVAGFMQAYPGVRDMQAFYVDLAAQVEAACPAGVPVHLALDGQYSKFRQMVVLHLPTRAVTSNWSDDNYLDWIPTGRRNQSAADGACTVEPVGAGQDAPGDRRVGPFRIALAHAGRIVLGEASGTHQRETDGANWWYWVEHGAHFPVLAQGAAADAGRTRLRFEVLLRGAQTLTLRVVQRDGGVQERQLHGADGATLNFDEVFALAPANVAELVIDSDGQATRLGPQDARLGAWMIRNIALSAAKR